MPTPKGTGAPLAPISLVTPGSFGLNKQQQNTVLPPPWATDATNAVFDNFGRLTARNGFVSGTTSPMSGTPVIDVLYEYIKADGTRSILSAGGNKIWSGVGAPSDITGTSTITQGDNWQFINFHDNVLAVQQGEQPLLSTGGDFADMVETTGTAPTGNCGLGSFGRVWIVDSDKQTIKYSDLLDETTWSGGSSGAIDMTSVWPNGIDEIVALAAYNGLLVVFGRNTIVFFGDGAGSALGIDPANIFVQDTLSGVGCIARDSVQQIDNGDILFLSVNGIQSLQRLIQERSNPINNVSKNIRDYMMDYVNATPTSEIRTVYAPRQGFYLLILPTMSRTFCFDTRVKLQDGSYRVTEWTNKIKAGVRSNDNTIYLSLSNLGGHIGTYSSYNDRDSSNDPITYDFRYSSGWLDLGEDFASYIKMLKEINGIVFYASLGNVIQITWSFDFQSIYRAVSVPFTAAIGSGEWGEGEWGLMEWGGGGSLNKFRVPASGAGQYIRIGVNVPIDQNTFSLQQLNLFSKIGRLAN